MPADESKSRLPTSDSEGLTVVGEDGFSIDAVQGTMDLGIVETADCRCAELCGVAAIKVVEEVLSLRSMVFIPLHEATFKPR